jgi:hypothetical protein
MSIKLRSAFMTALKNHVTCEQVSRAQLEDRVNRLTRSATAAFEL